MPQKSDQANSATPSPGAIDNAVKLGAEYILPGGSLLLNGRIKEGGLHTAAGWLGSAILGPVGWLLVVANSYSRSTTNRNLIEHVRAGSSE
jgi:hypothetical protein